MYYFVFKTKITVRTKNKTNTWALNKNPNMSVSKPFQKTSKKAQHLHWAVNKYKTHKQVARVYKQKKSQHLSGK